MSWHHSTSLWLCRLPSVLYKMIWRQFHQFIFNFHLLSPIIWYLFGFLNIVINAKIIYLRKTNGDPQCRSNGFPESLTKLAYEKKKQLAKMQAGKTDWSKLTEPHHSHHGTVQSHGGVPGCDQWLSINAKTQSPGWRFKILNKIYRLMKLCVESHVPQHVWMTTLSKWVGKVKLAMDSKALVLYGM